MIEMLKSKMQGNYKKAIFWVVVYLVVKWTIILTIGSYLHAKGYTQYWYVLIPILAVMAWAYVVWKRRKNANKTPAPDIILAREEPKNTAE